MRDPNAYIQGRADQHVEIDTGKTDASYTISKILLPDSKRKWGKKQIYCNGCKVGRERPVESLRKLERQGMMQKNSAR